MIDQTKKVVVVFLEINKDGKIPVKNWYPPYGYHHILKVYPDNSFYTVATVDSIIQDKEKIMEIAKMITECFNNEVKIEIDSDFYSKY
jgi:hypothetical protein